VLFNFLKLTIDDINSEFREGFWINNIFNGYNVATYLVVCNLAFTGLLVSWIMKFADSIVKVRAGCGIRGVRW
jgi:UDP-sugar transporter A1/2/3